MNRVHLGWDAAPLARAADWLLRECGTDMTGLLVVLPGARSGRTLSELVARRAGRDWRPPRFVTAGAATDHLLEIHGRPASRLVRTLAWSQALQQLAPTELRRIVARPPAASDQLGWHRLAEEVRSLFGEVAADGLDFHGIVAGGQLAVAAGEVARWRALAAAQTAMQQFLATVAQVDPHRARLDAIADGTTASDVRGVILVGVVEMTGLLRRALSQCPAPVTILTFAPQEQAEAFDEWGCLRCDHWADRTSALRDDQWHVAADPDTQAERTLDILAGWHPRYAAEQITIGVADPEVGRYLARRLAVHDVATRDATGTPLRRTTPARLLAAAAGFLEHRRFQDLAALVRHPAFEAGLRRAAPDLEPASLLDDYQPRHLPNTVSPDWVTTDWPGRPQEVDRLRRLATAAQELLGDLDAVGPRPLADWVPAIRRLLTEVYGGRSYDPSTAADHDTVEALDILGRGLDQLGDLPATLMPRTVAAAAVEFLLRDTRSSYVRPRDSETRPTIELLGWLELPLDDAPALVVTGFEEGRVPEPLGGEAFLPDGLRRGLGLVDDRQRLARDLYFTELLVRSRGDVAFVSGRRSLAGDPQLPSRIVFHCAPTDTVGRIRKFLAGGPPRAPAAPPAEPAPRQLPRRPTTPPLTTIPVTAFRLFLASPYQFYLERVARLKTVAEAPREMDPLVFGDLAHLVLQRFGESDDLRDSQDAGEIGEFLARQLHREARQRFGTDPLPAVRLQLEQLDHRLQHFAAVQAARRRQGWRIAHVEWQPGDGGIDFDVDGEPIRLRGRIDRIDYHADSDRWAVWDYKTGENVSKPEIAHCRADGSFKDLQLPLYCLLTRDLTGRDYPDELGYVALGRDPESIGFLAVQDWRGQRPAATNFPDGLDRAYETARQVIRDIRAGRFFEVGDWQPEEPVWRALCGSDLIDGQEVTG